MADRRYCECDAIVGLSFAIDEVDASKYANDDALLAALEKAEKDAKAIIEECKKQLEGKTFEIKDGITMSVYILNQRTVIAKIPEEPTSRKNWIKKGVDYLFGEEHRGCGVHPDRGLWTGNVVLGNNIKGIGYFTTLEEAQEVAESTLLELEEKEQK